MTATAAKPRALARVMAVLAGVMFAGGAAFSWLGRNVEQTSWGGTGIFSQLAFLSLLVTFPLVGYVLTTRKPGNAIGWLTLSIGLVWNLDSLLGGYGGYGVFVRPGSPGAGAAASFDAWLWVPAIGLAATFLILLFPDGHLPSPRWRWFARFTAIVLTISAVSVLLSPGILDGFPGVRNAFGIQALAPVLDAFQFFIFFIPVCMIGAAVSIVLRFRRSAGVERLQLKWLATAAGTVAGIFLLVMLPALLAASFQTDTTPGWLQYMQDISLLSFSLIPIAIGFAVLKYRLYEIDVVISKTVVFAGLAAFITIVYIAIVVGVGRLIGTGDGGAGLQIAATAIVALLFQPARNRVRRFANRLVYGKRATPYEVMAELSRRMAGTLEIDRALPELAETAGSGVAASVARVTLFLPGGARRTAFAPVGAEAPADWAATVQVRHQGDPVGEIAVAKPAGDALRPAERALLEDLAGQAGLALHNARLTDELAARAEDLTVTAAALETSRHRIVRVRDEQRRRLEREISDGPRAGLESITAELGRLVDEAPDESDGIAPALDRLGEQANETLDRLRELARGIFPPLLSDQGTAAALEAHVRKVGVDATLDISPAVSSSRFDPEIETCVYFCCLQAIQNVKRHAGEVPVHIELSTDEEALVFEIRDEGPGFDAATTPEGTGTTIMRDRTDALGGTLQVGSEPGHGTTVRGRIPIPSLVAANR